MSAERKDRRSTDVESPAQLSLPIIGIEAPVAKLRATYGNKPFLMAVHHFPLEEGVVEMEVEVGDNNSYSFCYTVKSDPRVGMATHRDKQLLTYVISAIAEMGRITGVVPQAIEIPIKEIISSRDQSVCGTAYDRVKLSLERLLATRIYTRIEVDDRGADQWFTWISSGEIKYNKRREANGSTRRVMHSITVKICDYLHREIEQDPELISYSPEFMRMTSPLLQRVYEVAKADTGREVFKISGAQLHQRAAPQMQFKVFKKCFRRAIERHHERLTGEEDDVFMPVPEFAIYPYNAAKPEKSSLWPARTAVKDQYFVFVCNGRQEEILDRHLDDIPDWDAGIRQEQIRAFKTAGAITHQEEAVMPVR
jgi:hypothetical protein